MKNPIIREKMSNTLKGRTKETHEYIRIANEKKSNYNMKNIEWMVVSRKKFSQPELDTLHKQIGEAHTKLAAIQSNAFADVLKLLKDDQKKNTDFVYETLGTLVGPVGRGAVMMRGGPGAMNRPGGPDSFVRPGGPDRQRGPDGRR